MAGHRAACSCHNNKHRLRHAVAAVITGGVATADTERRTRVMVGLRPSTRRQSRAGARDSTVTLRDRWSEELLHPGGHHPATNRDASVPMPGIRVVVSLLVVALLLPAAVAPCLEHRG